jgi:hypothetical protein
MPVSICLMLFPTYEFKDLVSRVGDRKVGCTGRGVRTARPAQAARHALPLRAAAAGCGSGGVRQFGQHCSRVRLRCEGNGRRR